MVGVMRKLTEAILLASLCIITICLVAFVFVILVNAPFRRPQLVCPDTYMQTPDNSFEGDEHVELTGGEGE